jgi:organic hydroperoxide reductase OsmC/OhrA
LGRWTEATLKEHIDAAVKVASALLAENYLAQDRKRLIKAIELLDEATRSLDGGIEIAGSSSPHSVPVPYSDVNAVDPEEAFVASIASCHMLWFLAIAAKRGYRIDTYADDAEGILEKDADSRMSMTRVVLRPRIAFGDDRQPPSAEVAAMHEEAHRKCYIANSVKTLIAIEPA